MDIDPRQIVPAAQAGVELLNLRSTLLPGDLKAQLVVLESVLMGIGAGALAVVPIPKNVVKSELDNDDSGDKKEDENGDD